MEVYILDSLYRRIEVVDKFESLIWTERFSSMGDFELLVHSTLQNRNRFVEGVRLGCNLSTRIMTVESAEDITDAEGRRMIRAKGPSLEGIFEHRLAMGDLTDLETDPRWEMTDLPKAIAGNLFHEICVLGILDPGDIIPGVIEGSFYPADTIDEPADTITYSIEPKNLYLAIKDLCDAFSMGFRLVKHPVTSVLYFDIYMGSDRTTSQTLLGAVVFSPDMENLRDTSRIKTMSIYKNVAYVVSPVGHEIVYALDVDPSIEGFERRVAIVIANDITDVVPADATAKMITRGTEELARHRRFEVLDGQLAQTSQYVYGVDYNLGDLVELRDDDGTTSKMQVTEQIFVQDKEGERSYPSLSINVFVTPGSWLSMGPTLEWDDMTTEHWDEMP